MFAGFDPDCLGYTRGCGNNNNEIVLDPRSLEAHLPHALLAFFIRPEPTHAAGEGEVRAQRAAFLRAYGLPTSAAPLVKCDLSQATGVFTLVEA